MGKIYEFTGYVTEVRLSTNLRNCRCAEITVESKHCQVIDFDSSRPYFMMAERKIMMDKESVKAFRLGQKLTITLSSDE